MESIYAASLNVQSPGDLLPAFVDVSGYRARRSSLPPNGGIYLCFDFNLLAGENRRFLFHPGRAEMVIGGAWNSRNLRSHELDFDLAGGQGDPDHWWVKGWVGIGRNFPSGIIHFTPPLNREWLSDPATFDGCFSCLEFWHKSGASLKTVVRGWGGRHEQPLGDILNPAYQ